MFAVAARYLAIFLSLLAFCIGLPVHLAAQNKAWLDEYKEHKAYGDVYVVKKVAVPCTSYETFLVDKNGKKLTPAFRDIGDFSEDRAEFVPMELGPDGKGLHGFIDRSGKIIVPAIYAGTDRFMNGKSWVIYPVGKQFGLSYIDKQGNTLYKIPIEHYKNDFLIAQAEQEHVCNHDTKEDIIWWRKGDMFILNWNFSKFNEQEIKRSKHIYHFNFRGKYGIIDKNMMLKVPVALDDIDPTYKFSGQGMERVQYGDKFGYISPFTGDLIVPFEYTDTRKPTAGLFWVKKNNKWGCIDKTGKVRINFLYDEATGFTSEDRSAVAINGKFGHIDKKGRIRTPLKYDFASYYNHGLSMVRLDDKYGYIDTTGKYITEIIYDEALPFDKTTTTAERSWLRYELSLDGKETFVGFSYKLNAVFILLALLLFVRINSYLFKKYQGKKWFKRSKA
ncbi:WG repeat-containing protein [Dyadobacter sp. Leaf189]|uniref:WG repeat-containing protein n=1 Tax=Dyadobacter sp. Leaf189 TaxID=1736295 RepID=UPI0009E8D0F8|nr:WG repeat-containing protein [Dyadobacter sp. Leaf189]